MIRKTSGKPRFTSCPKGFPQNRQNYPQTLLALLWIRCSLTATRLARHGLQLFDQKITDRPVKPSLFISHGFYSLCRWKNAGHTHTCPHLLWVVMWITCSPNAASHGGHSANRDRSNFIQF
ncbi:Hypothetical protein PSEBR_m1640 [Pseudomonas brassicacearum subsp. brassicacearum NFM421]|uniref:Uncharacterized protein n=1 Tax=Pseudomonas brassicacearum (strain NFM421) TaxID=994484 RepID=F2K5X7_PSEBN|nr:Hypothetical protein PSEBR_m1640 [Pseudomonas brassicacearum subsp. brassicacearum NFM421]